MVSSVLKSELELKIGEPILKTTSLMGGSINAVFKITGTNQEYVLKQNKNTPISFFEAEAYGLKLLSNKSSFTIPEVIEVGVLDSKSYILLSFIESNTPKQNFWTDFADKLAQLHKITIPYFGLDQDNFIGSLPQYNSQQETASSFFIEQRLIPQFELARRKGFPFKDLNAFYKNIQKTIPEEPSALIHGDLWSGNYLVDENGLPALIDPAVAYAPREMDIAMMHMFGGFRQELFDIYHEIFPMQQGWEKRIDLWQLYYVLVHVNLFGGSYYSQANSIVKDYL